MTTERELVRIAMSFTAGIVISTLTASHMAGISTTPATLALAITAVCTAHLLHQKDKGLNHRLLWIVITILFLCLGYFISESERLLALSGPGAFSGISEYALGFGENLAGTIADIPFEDRNTSSLITALITGNRSGLSRDTITIFRESGASHILALSGLHLGIIYGILKWTASVFGGGRKQKILRAAMLITLCGFYTLATGASASITRAFLFITLNETASVTGRFRSTGSILWTALLLQLFFSPESATDVGFKLSYAAMAGIAYIYPHLKKLWPERNSGAVRKGLKWIWNSASISIACQIATGPLAWIYFGTFPQYFLLTNLISLPLAGLIIPASLAVIGLHTCGICPDFLVEALESLVCALIFCLETIAGL